MDRMSPLDASFLHIEDSDRTVGMHIGSTAVFAGPPPDQATFTRTVESRLPLVPRYRQRVEAVPLGLGRPVWVDDVDFTLDYHLRRTALPAPGGEPELRRLVARLMSQRLDRTKPLWEMWIVEGLADGQWAMVSKVHHCMVDGISGVELLAVMMDLSDEPPAAEPVPWEPERPLSRTDLALRTVGELATSQYEQLRVVGHMVRQPRRLLEPAGEVVAGLRSLAGLARPAASALSGSIGPHREVAWAETDLASVKKVRAALGGTVNDVVLTAITRGFRELLLARGEDVTDRAVRTLVPVSVRSSRADSGAAAHDGTFDNKVSAMFAELPVSLADPVEVLGVIQRQLGDLKESKQAVAGEALTSLSGFAPPVLLGLGMRLAARVVSRTGNVHTVTTNVPGPQLPLYSCGRLMLKAYPYVPIAAPMRIGVSIFSYNGTVTFGITGDRDVSADIPTLATGITTAVTELLEAAAAAEASAAKAAKPPKAGKAGKAGKAATTTA
ncbi:MAG TPA: wax ester/triacylglycerol synthase family O-acyltransferase [Acidimicrobiales bacterium]|nr:wax ester/triacylglycerol synthase family O-acyltransferase [Acidimicrobiales bacterium]